MRFFLLTGSLVVIVFALAIIWLYPSSGSPQNQNNIPPGTTFPATGNTSSSGSSTPSDTIPLASTGNGSIASRNFLSDSDVGTLASGYYYLGFHSSTDPYQIVYQSSSQSFTIELLKEPIGATRTQAEQYLETKLGLSQSDMCRLDYTLSVPWNVNETYSSRNLLFSFCPGAVQLPT